MALQRERPIARIEHRSSKKVMIDALETDETLAKCHPQTQSALFSLLPREIREEIWAYATAPHDDPTQAYAENEYYYRPGHTAKLKSDTDLLLTCRRIWLEANRFPMLQAEHCFWYYRAAPDGRDREWMSRLSPLNRQNFGQLHLFAQMYAIESLRADPGHLRQYFLPANLGRPSDFQPRMLHVTIRHTDWWWWESDEPLRFEDSWLQALLDTPDLRSTQTLKLELETLEYKVPQLLPIVERLENLQSQEFETHIVNGKNVTTKFILHAEREESTWDGPINIDNVDFDPYKDKKRLHYHIITLTWKLQFPQQPKAHIPTVRLSPRLPVLQRTFLSHSFHSLHFDRPYHGGFESDWHLTHRDPDPYRSYFCKPMRRRDYKKIKLGRMVPRMHQPEAKALDEALRVRMTSVSQAERMEHVRLLDYEKMMESHWADTYTALWESTGSGGGLGSLLKFAD